MYFAPYYTLGIAALFWHVAATMARHPVRRTRATTIGAAGTIFAIALIVTLPGGVFCHRAARALHRLSRYVLDLVSCHPNAPFRPSA